MAIEFIKVDLTDNLGSPWNISQNKEEQYWLHIKRENYEFSSKKPSATKHSPPSNVYYIEFNRNFLFHIV